MTYQWPASLYLTSETLSSSGDEWLMDKEHLGFSCVALSKENPDWNLKLEDAIKDCQEWRLEDVHTDQDSALYSSSTAQHWFKVEQGVGMWEPSSHYIKSSAVYHYFDPEESEDVEQFYGTTK
jgi:hypothetical protein